jgi:EmrB/QacA subfamily drug resistance transporter
VTTKTPAADYTPDPRRWRVLGVLSLALFMSLIDVSIVNVALPSIQRGLAANDSQLQWILAGYALTFGIGLVAAGRAGDLYGRGPLFILGVVLFTGASAWAGLSSDALWLNIARALEGLGSGLISPQVIGMIQQYFRGAERGRAFGIFGGVVGASVAIGPVLGGLLIQLGGIENGWRWIFFVNLPFGVLAIVLALLWIPRPLFTRTQDGPEAGPLERDLDPVGSVLLGLAVLGLLLPFVESGRSVIVWIALPVGVALLAVWVWWERRYKQSGRSPMVDLAIFQVVSFRNGTLVIGLYFLGMTSVWVLVALYFQDGLGHSALASGLVGLPSAVLSGLSALWAGRLVATHGRKVVIAGLYCAILGLLLCVLVVWFHERGDLSEWWLLLSLAFIGIAQGSVISPNQALTLAEVPLTYAGSSGGVMQTVQRIGTSMGIAIITAIAFSVLRGGGWAAAFIIGFAAIGVVVVLALAVAHLDLHQRRGRSSWL